MPLIPPGATEIIDRPMSAMDRALAQIDALFAKPRHEVLAEMQRRWNAGERPLTDIYGRPIIDDLDTYRRRIETAQRAACWETLAGQVEAARAEIEEAA